MKESNELLRRFVCEAHASCEKSVCPRQNFDSIDPFTVKYSHNNNRVCLGLGYDKGELTSSWEIEAARTREEDRRDFERELAGIDIGREARFHSTEFVEERRQGRGGSSNAQRTAQQQYASRLQMLLATNPAYAKLYNDTMDALGDAEAATDRAIAKAQEALEDAQRQLEQTLNRAAKLPDGTRVFRDARGHVWNERRQRVSEADAAGIEWRGDEPAYEQFLEDSESARDRLTRLEALQGFRVDTLGRFRDRLMDEDHPVSEPELRDINRQIEQGMQQRQIVEPNISAAQLVPRTSSATMSVPDLSG